MRLINLFFEDNDERFWSYLQVLYWKKFPGVNRVEIQLTDGTKTFADGKYATYLESGINSPISVIIEQRLPWE